MVTVLEDLLGWSRERPAWQRDALRRLVLKGELSDTDVFELTEICKGSHGLTEPQLIAPLARDHIPEERTGSVPVSLVSIFHHRGVNALAEDQTLPFGPDLTVVYGDNAAGKTGYIRILKSACRVRGQESILGNVASSAAPLSPVVAIKYKVGTEAAVREWSGGGADEFISRVSVFDSQSAGIYLTEKTDVAFRPFGLDLFDRLVRACRAVRARLEGEQRALVSNALAEIQAQIPAGTVVARLLANITSLTKPEAVRALARWSADDEARLALATKSLLDLQANEPEQLVRVLVLRGGRIRALARHALRLETLLSEDAVREVFDVRTEGRLKRQEAKRLHEATFPSGMLTGTGSEAWAALWEAARCFSTDDAYPGRAFPVVEEGAVCVLCQQDLNDATSRRLTQFEAFVTSTTERELRALRGKFLQMRKAVTEFHTRSETVVEALKELRLESEEESEAVAAALDRNEERRTAVALALREDEDLPADCPPLVSVAREVDTLADQIDERVLTLRKKATTEIRNRLASEVQELQARKLLAQHESAVLNEIEAKKRSAAYGLCISDTTTNAITQKSTAVTKSVVSQKLKQRFRDELAGLRFSHVEVELREAGGAEGVLYHKLILTRAPGVELPRVVSEGEQRCLAIAAFFAELAAADDPSGIVFDDPVSSLDYRWRENVARRLVQEAKARQVVVFTHDVVFLLLLRQFAEAGGVDQQDQHVRQLSGGAGVCAAELPWVAMPVKKKIGYLKSEWQRVDGLFRGGHQVAYEKDAKYLYGLLREAWERALEEVLLGGIVERFRPSIQTQHINTIADVTTNDCSAVHAAMTKCSKWLPGHDQAAAARAPVPEPTELQADIEALESWVAAIRARRK